MDYRICLTLYVWRRQLYVAICDVDFLPFWFMTPTFSDIQAWPIKLWLWTFSDLNLPITIYPSIKYNFDIFPAFTDDTLHGVEYTIHFLPLVHYLLLLYHYLHFVSSILYLGLPVSFLLRYFSLTVPRRFWKLGMFSEVQRNFQMFLHIMLNTLLQEL